MAKQQAWLKLSVVLVDDTNMMTAVARGISGSKYDLIRDQQILTQIQLKAIRTGATWHIGNQQYEIRRDSQRKNTLAFMLDGIQHGWVTRPSFMRSDYIGEFRGQSCGTIERQGFWQNRVISRLVNVDPQLELWLVVVAVMAYTRDDAAVVASTTAASS